MKRFLVSSIMPCGGILLSIGEGSIVRPAIRMRGLERSEDPQARRLVGPRTRALPRPK
ncbi:hypothetical protein BH18ACT15_BH18ACT15_11670 [soil metagenome]